jgi:hypothetical protein
MVAPVLTAIAILVGGLFALGAQPILAEDAWLVGPILRALPSSGARWWA